MAPWMQMAASSGAMAQSGCAKRASHREDLHPSRRSQLLPPSFLQREKTALTSSSRSSELPTRTSRKRSHTAILGSTRQRLPSRRRRRERLLPWSGCRRRRLQRPLRRLHRSRLRLRSWRLSGCRARAELSRQRRPLRRRGQGNPLHWSARGQPRQHNREHRRRQQLLLLGAWRQPRLPVMLALGKPEQHLRPRRRGRQLPWRRHAQPTQWLNRPHRASSPSRQQVMLE
mmetsp:Transcript_1326/g.3355  ORF Transcript_1326/g.3355 Transcript_1326/m.3355 type:complete len:229 (-) Transcript_1326:29-715(-)